MTLVKADLGIKRVCPSCTARFYDLQKRPIECPKCAFSFEPEALYKQRRPRPAEPEKPIGKPAVEKSEELQEAEEMEAEDVDESVDEGPVALEDADDDIVETEEEEAESAGMTVVDPAAQGGEIEDIETEEIAEEDVEDPVLLEEVGEEEEDVSGIIDADIEKDER
jgi:uncharacterized protein (TIGR02300 family)